MEKLEGSAQIIAKIEDQEAIRNIDSIIQATDVIMIARGDLGVEVEFEELPILQRRIVRRCHELGRRVIVATQLLESMISNPTPTRAEVTDVSNATFEEADALMLSGETSVGAYPLRCMEALVRISSRIERSGGLGYAEHAILRDERQKTCRAAVILADSLPGACLIILTRRGIVANHAALLRPRTPLYAFSPKDRVCRQLALSRGVTSFQLAFSPTIDETIQRAAEIGSGEITHQIGYNLSGSTEETEQGVLSQCSGIGAHLITTAIGGDRGGTAAGGDADCVVGGITGCHREGA
jgi:pyruvate kinase